MFGVAPPGLGQNRPWRPDQVLTNFVWERAERCVELEGRCREEISAAAAAVAAVPTVVGRNGQPIPRTKRPEDVARLIEQHGVVVLDLSHELAGAIAQARALDPTGKSPAASDYQQQSALAQARQQRPMLRQRVQRQQRRAGRGRGRQRRARRGQHRGGAAGGFADRSAHRSWLASHSGAAAAGC
jgi:hypothetical protein